MNALADSEGADVVNAGGRLERLPLGLFHWTVCAIIGATMFFDGYDIAVTGLGLPALMKSGLLHESQRALFVSLPLFSAAIGSILAGVVGDRIGRRRLVILNVVIFSSMSALCALSTSYPMLLTLRTLGMLAMGMQVPTGYSYMSEFTPHAVRGRFQSIIALLINGALPIFTVLAWLVLPHLSSNVSWRLLFGISIIALPLALAPRTMLPESPRWLMSVGRSAEADAILTRIEGGYAKRGVVLPPPMILPPPLKNLGWSALIASGVRSRTALAIAFQILQLSSIYVLNNWLPTLFVKRGYDAATTFGFAALTFAGQILGPAVGVLISDRFERRWLLAGAALIGAVMAMIYANQTTHLGIIATGLTLTTCITFISAVGFGSYLPELWPTGIRLRGMGVAALAGRFASSLTPFAVEAALGVARDPFVIIAGIGAMYGLLALLFALLGPNTRGRSLEIIEHQVAKDSRLG